MACLETGKFEVEDRLKAILTASVPDDFDVPERSSDLVADLADAPTKEEFALCFSLDYPETYFSYLRKGFERIGTDMTSLPDVLEHYKEAERFLPEMMLRDNMDYSDMIRTMACSIFYYEMENLTREEVWFGAALSVSSQVNPLLSRPELRFAEDIHQQARRSLREDNPQKLYFSCLKAVLLRDPRLPLKEADVQVGSLIAKNFGRNTAFACLQFSPEFALSHTERESDSLDELMEINEDFVEQRKKINACLDTEADFHRKENLKERLGPDFEVYQTMRKDIQNITDSDRVQNIVSLYRNTIATINAALYQIRGMETNLMLIRDWGNVIQKASKELSIEPPKELGKILEHTDKIMQRCDDEQKSWIFIYDAIPKIDDFSKTTLSEIVEQLRRNPILSIPEVQRAGKFSDVMASDWHPPEDIYFAALRENVLQHPGIQQQDADKKVIDTLHAASFSDYQIATCLACSPQFSRIPKGQRIPEAEHFSSIYKEEKTQHHQR